MARLRDRFEVKAPVGEVEVLCKEAVADLGWKVQKIGADRLLTRGPGRVWCSNVLIVWRQAGPDQTEVSVGGNMAGWNVANLRGQIGAVRNKIEVLAARRGR